VCALAAPAAQADIIAAVEVASPSGADLDIALVNAATGLRTALPAGINTSANELHPSLSDDGRRLVFQRVDVAAATSRTIAYDFSTGRSADLFDAFEAQQDQPGTPAMLDDGAAVLTGRPLEHKDPNQPPGSLQPSFTLTSLINFPDGPFTKTRSFMAKSFNDPGRTAHPVDRSGTFAVEIRFQSPSVKSQIEVVGRNGTALLADADAFVRHPALTSAIVLFERSPFLKGAPSLADLAFRTSDAANVATAANGFLPALVDSPRDESRPAFTGDDRFLGFVRQGADGHDRLLVFDTQTQTLLNANGIDLGGLAPIAGGLARRDGGLFLQQKLVLSTASLNLNSLITATLVTPTGVGILVQRIVGRHKLLGKTVPTLRFVGRVPFGPQKAGRFRVRWDQKVNGRRLKPGRYLVTVRAVTRGGVVRELGRSFTMRVR
jgi:hypothetical protein